VRSRTAYSTPSFWIMVHDELVRGTEMESEVDLLDVVEVLEASGSRAASPYGMVSARLTPATFPAMNYITIGNTLY
jgi:hypothetical protein